MSRRHELGAASSGVGLEFRRRGSTARETEAQAITRAWSILGVADVARRAGRCSGSRRPLRGTSVFATTLMSTPGPLVVHRGADDQHASLARAARTACPRVPALRDPGGSSNAVDAASLP
jgi:hypothetical protein